MGVDYPRMRMMLKRQYPAKFGNAYEPAIQAHRAEAPTISTASTYWSPVLQRKRHSFSLGERAVNAIVDYLLSNQMPAGRQLKLIDAQEQKIIPFCEELHPFSSHVRAAGSHLPRVRGTVAVAADLGYLKFHPTVITDAGAAAPYPYVNDCLLFLVDEDGPYCTNLTVKNSAEGFLISPKQRRRRAGPNPRTVARQEVEERTYGEAGIRTQRVISADLHPTLIVNLNELLKWEWRNRELATEQEQAILYALRRGLSAGALPIDVMIPLQHRCRATLEQIKRVFYGAVWNRLLLVDLYEPLQMDQPLQPEINDPRTQYLHWFLRSKQ